jgi:hypothetical protein
MLSSGRVHLSCACSGPLICEPFRRPTSARLVGLPVDRRFDPDGAARYLRGKRAAPAAVAAQPTPVADGHWRDTRTTDLHRQWSRPGRGLEQSEFAAAENAAEFDDEDGNHSCRFGSRWPGRLSSRRGCLPHLSRQLSSARAHDRRRADNARLTCLHAYDATRRRVDRK